jgi:hypothetical protein
VWKNSGITVQLNMRNVLVRAEDKEIRIYAF